MHKLFKKIISVFIIVIFSLMAVKPVFAGHVSGYFSDKEISTRNIFSVTTLDFSLRDTSDNFLTSPLFNISAMIPGNYETKTVRIKKDGALDFKYNIVFSKTSGDDVLCDALKIEAKLDGTTVYNGSLSAFNLSSIPTVTAGQDDWEMTVSLSDSSSGLKNKNCSFDLTYKGWQEDSDGTWGFTDTHLLMSSITSGTTWTLPNTVVINEVMWMGSNGHTSDEWIELRNTTANIIDLTGWKIDGAGEGADSITLSGTVSANGFFLLSNYPTNDGSSAINDSITADQDTTSLGLDNDGEQLTLRNGSNNMIDQTPTGAWPKGTNGPPEWKSMERNDSPSDGTDGNNWHQCDADACHSTTYWDADNHNWGTPKTSNLSPNDPTSPDFESPKEDSASATISAELSENTEETSLGEPPITPTPGEEPTITPLSPTPTESGPSPTPTPEAVLTPEVTLTPNPEEVIQ